MNFLIEAVLYLTYLAFFYLATLFFVWFLKKIFSL